MNHYLRSGIYVSAFRELLDVVDEKESAILGILDPNTEDEAFLLLGWASNTIREISADRE